MCHTHHKAASKGDADRDIGGRKMSKLREKALKAAERYLEARGYDIVAVSPKISEADRIDIIATQNDTLVLAEVYARADTKSGFPSEHLTDQVREAREHEALLWFAEYGEDFIGYELRFDVISIVAAGNRALLRHHINAMSMMAEERFGALQEHKPQLAAAAA